MLISSHHNQEPNFWWGSATSAYQVEGSNNASDWAMWEKKLGWPECGQAVRHYEKFREDFAWAKSLGQNAHRFSVEWSRLEPVEGKFSTTAIAHYHEVINSLKHNGLKVCLTLNHFTLPFWLARKGGWENPQVIQYFLTFVKLVVREYGSQVDLWLTINEPLILASEGYWFGRWPPRVRSRSRMVKVVRTLAAAHNQAYDEIHGSLPGAHVGLAYNFFSLVPLRSWFWPDRLATRRADKFWHAWFMKLTQRHHDFLGVNYYFHQRVFFSLNPRRNFIGFANPKRLAKEVSALGWEIYPTGLKEVLIKLSVQYRLPLYVTENGLAPLNNQQQVSFLLRSLAAVAQARRDGVPIRGYFYWSLLDNFEWHKGFGPKFGLLAVEPRTYKRLPKPAALVYAAICSVGEPTEATISKLKSSVH